MWKETRMPLYSTHVFPLGANACHRQLYVPCTERGLEPDGKNWREDLQPGFTIPGVFYQRKTLVNLKHLIKSSFSTYVLCNKDCFTKYGGIKVQTTCYHHLRLFCNHSAHYSVENWVVINTNLLHHILHGKTRPSCDGCINLNNVSVIRNWT
jgi:hypothetical protein